jgi:hypothetical protein
LQIGGGTGRDVRGRQNRRSGVEHLVSPGQFGSRIGSTLSWGRGGWRSRSGQRRRGTISSGGGGGWRVLRCRPIRLHRGGGFLAAGGWGRSRRPGLSGDGGLPITRRIIGGCGDRSGHRCRDVIGSAIGDGESGF